MNLNMKTLFATLTRIIAVIAMLVFTSGIVITVLGGYDFIHAFSYLGAENKSSRIGLLAVGLLRAVDLFLIAIVFFVFSLGILILFNNKGDAAFLGKLPEWLRIKNFMQLKIILWEAILTTLVVSYLARLAEERMSGEASGVKDLIIPGAILLIAVSLFLLKKSNGKE